MHTAQLAGDAPGNACDGDGGAVILRVGGDGGLTEGLRLAIERESGRLVAEACGHPAEVAVVVGKVELRARIVFIVISCRAFSSTDRGKITVCGRLEQSLFNPFTERNGDSNTKFQRSLLPQRRGGAEGENAK